MTTTAPWTMGQRLGEGTIVAIDWSPTRGCWMATLEPDDGGRLYCVYADNQVTA